MHQTEPKGWHPLQAVAWLLMLVLIFRVATYVVFDWLPSQSLLVPRAGSSDSEIVIRISGTSGLVYSGNYLVFSASGSASKTVDGIVPAEYQVEGRSVSISFQKKAESGILKVEILKDGKLIKDAETTAGYGIVSVVTR